MRRSPEWFSLLNGHPDGKSCRLAWHINMLLYAELSLQSRRMQGPKYIESEATGKVMYISSTVIVLPLLYQRGNISKEIVHLRFLWIPIKKYCDI